MNKVVIMGVGLSEADLTPGQLEIIRNADLLVGGRRLLEFFADQPMEKQAIKGPLPELIDTICQRRKKDRIVVLASGDPLFFGIGARLIDALGPDAVTVRPNITSVSAAFARLKMPYNEARLVSLHGRNRRYALLQALKTPGPVAVLTDAKQSPQRLAKWLQERGVKGWQMAVFEQLGAPSECFGRYRLEEAADKSFAQPNVVVLIKNSCETPGDDLTLGMPEAAYLHEGGLITKAEVRAVTLAKLCLKPGMTLWDLGAGSGSVGIEASLLIGPGRIVAVEQKAQRAQQIRRNAQRMGVFNLDVVSDRLPRALEGLPDPDRIFIGGGGQDLDAIVAAAADRLKPGGVMVVNTVLVENLPRVLWAMEAKKMQPEMVQLQVNRGKSMPWSRRLEAENPVWIIKGRR